ncbi:MAG: SPOR domain-containing protein [Flavobacteriales bacterium]|nr:SPOR domain-containing protein [Flavobacteriales bacterium]
MGLERDLHHLLFEHDCVIVPGWGGFLAQYRPARLDETRQLIHPPSKEVGFNRHLLRNDGLLTDHLAQRDGIGFAAANALIDREVGVWREQLDATGRVEIPRIGIFYRDVQRNLQFDPDDRANFLKEAFGLRPVAATPVVRIAAEPRVIPLPTPLPAAPVPQPRSRNWAAAAAVALLLASGAVIGYIGLNGGTDAFAFGPRPAATYSPSAEPVPAMQARASVFALPEGSFGVQTLPLTDNDSVSLTVDLGEAPADTTAVAITAKSAMRLRFHVVGGCFAQPENAERLLKELQDKGYHATRLPRYGELHPVAYGSYADRQEALEALASVRRDGVGQAWLLVR